MSKIKNSKLTFDSQIKLKKFELDHQYKPIEF